MRVAGVALLVIALLMIESMGLSGPAAAMSATGALPPELAAAQDAFNQNLALAKSLAGQEVTPEQAAEADRLAQDGVTKALDYAMAKPRSADAHHLGGMLLIFSYRPVESKVSVTDSKTGEVSQDALIALRQGAPQYRDQGLAELRAAVKLARTNVDYQTDYAEAMRMCDDAVRSAGLLNALWQRKEAMTGVQRARIARLAAQAAQAQNDNAAEVRWLREVLKSDPKDEAAKTRLAELVPKGLAGAGLAWQTYEDGMALAAAEGKLVMIDFMADWCGWCKKLDAEVYSQKEVVDLGTRFVCVKVNGDARRDLVRKYRVDGYPTILFLNAEGREIHRVSGYETARRFVDDMQAALSRQ